MHAVDVAMLLMESVTRDIATSLRVLICTSARLQQQQQEALSFTHLPIFTNTQTLTIHTKPQLTDDNNSNSNSNRLISSSRVTVHK